jgi:hypothetical protein
VWYADTIVPDKKTIEQFSWGPVEFISNSGCCLGIDLETENPRFYIDSQGDYEIRNVVKTDDTTYRLDFFFSRGNFMIQCVIHMSSNDEFWIEPIEGISLFPTGTDKIYHNLSRPPARPTHKTTDSLRLRNNAGVSALIITILEKGTGVEVLESGKEETVDGITAPWVKVRSSTGHAGWCFSGYLEKL